MVRTIMSTVIAAASAVLVVAGATTIAVNAQPREPTGFRDALWGASEQTLRASVAIESCVKNAPTDPDYGERRCYTPLDSLKIGDIPILSGTFYLREDKLVGWMLMYHRNHRALMIDALKQRYGAPTEERRDALRWTGTTTVLSLSSYGDKDFVRAVTKTEIATWTAQRKKAAGKAAGGF
jgi:hypothetical protein